MLLIIFNLILLLFTIYFNIFSVFPCFSDIFVAKEGADFVFSTFSFIKTTTILVVAISIFFGVMYCKNIPKKKNYGIFIISLFLIVLFRWYALYNLGKLPDKINWDVFNNNRYIYNNHSNTKKAYMISGLYEYIFSDFYITFLKQDDIDKDKLIEEINNEFTNNPKNHNKNVYTGIFKDKNLIFIMLETIEDWMINTDNMPTLNRLMEEGINFSNHYSVNYRAGHTFNTEFIANTGLIPLGDTMVLNRAYSKNDFSTSLPNLFKNAGYITNSYHKNSGTFYNRSEIHVNWGYQRYYNSGDMNMPSGYSDYDSHMIYGGFNKIVSDNKFMSFIITYSAHMPYKYTKPECNDNLDFVKQYINSNNEEYLCAMAQSHETDNFFKELLNTLEKDNKLDNTVIVGFTDHYAYGIDKNLLYDLKKETDMNLIQKTPFFIWSNDINSVEIKEVTSTIDILPTIANLFDLDWNPNYYVGSDALDSNYKELVFFKDHSWYDGETYFNINDGRNLNVDKGYLNTIDNIVNNKFNLSKNILMTDYFRYNK